MDKLDTKGTGEYADGDTRKHTLKSGLGHYIDFWEEGVISMKTPGFPNTIKNRIKGDILL